MTGLINHQKFNPNDTPALTDKIAVLTGGTGGIGRDIAAQLLKHDIGKIYIISRSPERFEGAKKFWVEKHGLKDEDVGRRVEFIQCDLSNIMAVKKVAGELVVKLDRLDILLLSAGIAPVKDYILSFQGIEMTWATNVVGHFVLTEILLQAIEDSAEAHGDARIITTSSPFHMGCRELDFNFTLSPTRYHSSKALDLITRYARSKLGTILFTRELVHRLHNHGAMNVFANIFFDGNVPTDAMNNWGEIFGNVVDASVKGKFEVVGQSPEDGAATAVYLAASEEVKEKGVKGKYFVPVAKEEETSDLAKDRDLARNLWYWCDNQVTGFLGKHWEDTGEREPNFL